MKKIFIPVCVIAGLFLMAFKYVNNNEPVKDYIHVPGPIKFNNASFELAWSSHPADNYYKQEYLVKGDSINHFNKMVLLDVLNDTVKPRDLVYRKIRSLDQRKKTDAVIQYNLIQSPDSSEYILDFVVSEGTPKINMVEWNAYRYLSFTNKAGRKGVLLFGISIHTYGNKITDFFGSLRDVRESVTNQLIGYQIPPISITDTHQK